MQVVLDTNILISGLFFGGKPAYIVELVFTRKITPCFTVTTWQELERVLAHPKFARQRAHLSFDIIDFLIHLQECVHIFPAPEKVVNIIPEDPADNQILACAVMAEVACIVSGDQHLRSLGRFHAIPIFTPDQFLKWYGTKK